MVKLIIVCALVALVSSTYALECYKCTGDECNKDQKSWTTDTCGTVQGSNPACLKQVYRDAKTQKDVTIRKCVIAKKTTSGLTHICDNQGGQEVACVLCEDKLCNSATSMFTSQYAIILGVLAYLIPKFLLH